MISVWPKFYTGIPNFTALNNAGDLYQPNITDGKKDFVGYNFTFYDAFKADARKLYWSQINTALFSKVWMRGGWTRPSRTSSKGHTPAWPRRFRCSRRT
jgi:alpha-glucosidase (family GH31 glycosyl hydrolase)